MTKIKFNPQQQEAVDAVDGAYSVVASAGSGKSALLLGRIEKLVKEHKVPEKEVLAITFTKAVADHMTNKLAEKDLHFINVGTFHSICGTILREEGIKINPYNMIQEWQIDNCFKEISPNVDTKEVMNWISYQRNRMKDYKSKQFDFKSTPYTDEQLRKYFKAYEDLKNKLNKYDFDDYLLLCLDLLQKNPNKYTYEYILVDEHQDSNKVQNKLLEKWCSSGNMFVVGDYRQCFIPETPVKTPNGYTQ